MRYVNWVGKLIVFVMFLVLALNNVESVTLRFAMGYDWTLPLIVLLFAFFVLGIAVGGLSTLEYYLKARREATQLQKALQSRDSPEHTVTKRSGSAVIHDPSDAVGD